MATVHTRPEFLICPVLRMNAVRNPFKSKIRFLSPNLKSFCTPSPRERAVRNRCKAKLRASDSELKENWLDSLSCPFQQTDLGERREREEICSSSAPQWAVGIDPDVSGALALLKDDSSDCSAQVFDTPHLQVLVGKRVRKRLDAKSIVQMLHSFGAPLGTTAYIEQSSPFPQDGKQGWWSGGFTYGLWIGILVSSGFSVVPVSSRLWKDKFQLSGNSSSKDDSRKAASDLFPSLSSSLKRKKDHGRAEALLIAAYGMGLKLQSTQSAASSVPLEPTVSVE